MSGPKAVKTVIQITVYSGYTFREDYAEDAEGFPFLDNVIYEMTHGNAVGDYEVVSSEDIEGEALRDGLIDIGNDGTFFDGDGDE